MNGRAVILALILAVALTACEPFPPPVYRFLDFERDADLDALQWECRHVYERARAHASHGEWALRADLPPGEYPGVEIARPPRDWSMFDALRFRVYVEGDRPLEATLRIDDDRPCTEFDDRANLPVHLVPGANDVRIPVRAVAQGPRARLLNVRQVRRMILYLSASDRREVLDLDDFRLVPGAGEKGR
jgi:hypothetical protein